MRNWLLKLKKDKRGGTAIEFAMVAPVLFLMIFGIMDFGMLAATHAVLEGATAGAARAYRADYAYTNGSGADINTIRNYVIRRGGGMIKPANMRVTARRLNSGWNGAAAACVPDPFTMSCGNSGTTGQVIQYRVFYDYHFLTPIIGKLISPSTNIITVRASMVVQNEPDID